MFEFGFAQENITPVRGVPLCGYLNPRPNQGVLDPLAVKAAVFRTGEVTAGIVICDLCFLQGALVERLIAALKSQQVAFAERILFAATHTHTGPYTAVCFNYFSDPAYLDMVVAQTVRAVQNAAANLAPAELFATSTECATLAYNRRYWMKNGAVLTNPGKLNPEIDRPEGGMDPEIPILAVRQNGNFSLILANIVNHTDTVGGNLVSADWPGRMEREIQDQLGYDLPVMTMIGTQGNINHFNVHTNADQTSYGEAVRIGKAYAGAILSALYQLEKIDCRSIEVRTGTIEVPYFQVSDEEYNAAAATFRKFQNATLEPGHDLTSEDIARKHPYVMKYFAQKLMDCRDKAISTKRVEKMISLRFGDKIGVVSLPAEPFVEIGLAVKRASRFPFTFVAALGMGEVGYVGLPEHYCHGGGYETSPSPDTADRNTGTRLVDAAAKLLQ